MTRRNFLRSTTVTGIAAGLLGGPALGRVLGANDTVQVGVVGLNGRGESHLSEFGKISGVRVAGLCDVDLRVLNRRGQKFEGAKQYQDVRQLVEDKNIDVVSVATPNHWHALMTIWACQAGKDVYVEKPCSHNLVEGRRCVEAARKYKRIVQHGTQSRSGNFARIPALVRSGNYGKLLISKGYCCKPRWSIGYKPIQSPPPDLDFNLWLGPAPEQPFHANLVHYNWHWFWDFGNGDMGNQGVHEIDMARWALGKKLPRTVVSLGGRWVNEPDFKDQGQTPNQIVSLFDYGDALLLFETRGLVAKDPRYPFKVGNELFFEAGVIRGDKFYPKNEGEGEPLAKVDFEVEPGGHFGNFIDCVRHRDFKRLNADILEGHLSSSLCHLGNISYQMGGPAPFEKPQDLNSSQVVGDSVMTLLENTKAIGVEPEKTILWAGSKLEFDPEAERFVDNSAADGLLTRPYREPFVVRKEV